MAPEPLAGEPLASEALASDGLALGSAALDSTALAAGLVGAASRLGFGAGLGAAALAGGGACPSNVTSSAALSRPCCQRGWLVAGLSTTSETRLLKGGFSGLPRPSTKSSCRLLLPVFQPLSQSGTF